MSNLFEAHNSELCQFERIENPAFPQPDLMAFLFLAKRFPMATGQDIISRAEHDAIYLATSTEDIESLTEDEVIFLLRCGVSYDRSESCLAMFV